MLVVPKMRSTLDPQFGEKLEQIAGRESVQLGAASAVIAFQSGPGKY